MTRTCLLSLAAVSAMLISTHSIAAQPKIPANEVVQLLEETVQKVLPDTTTLSQVSIAKRTVVVDYRRSFEAFGFGADAPVDPLRMGGRLLNGTRDLLDDCDQIGSMSCARIGWRAYVYASPISISGANALIRFTVVWAGHDPNSYISGTEPVRTKGRRVFLTSFSSEVRLLRSAAGKWKVVSVGKTVAS